MTLDRVPAAPPATARAAFWTTMALLAWGALAFGAVYPWAYWPLAVACQAAGILGVLAERRAAAGASRTLTIALVALLFAILAQLLPLGPSLLERISPNTVEAARQLDPAFAAGLSPRHPLSIAPHLTWTALALYASFALLLAGVSRLVSLQGASRLITALAILGVVIALVGIVQRPLYAGKIYGFWTPQLPGQAFGPFVNKNHFAGWMLMALPLVLGLLCAGIARGMRGVRPILRERLLWLGSPDASRIVLLAGAAAVMGLALVLTMSRSGISAMALSLALTGGFVMAGRTTGSRKAFAAGYLVLLAVLVVGWVGADAIAARFAAADWGEFNARRGAWADAWRVAQAFPLAGTGLNTYGTSMLFYQQHDLARHYAQAHSDYLQLAAEGGLLLGLPILICVALFARDVRRRFREDGDSSSYWLRAGAVAGLAAIALQSTVEFSLQMPGNAALFAVTCGIALHKAPARLGAREEQAAGGLGTRISQRWAAAGGVDLPDPSRSKPRQS